MTLGGDEGVDREGRAGAQDRPHIVRVGNLVEDDDEALGRQVADVDRRERPRFEQHALMHRLARRARADLLKAHNMRLDSARGNLGAEPSRRRLGGVKADEFPIARLERRFDTVKAIDARDVGVAPLARLLAARRPQVRPRGRGPRPVLRAGCATRLALGLGQRVDAPVALAGHPGDTPSRLRENDGNFKRVRRARTETARRRPGTKDFSS